MKVGVFMNRNVESHFSMLPHADIQRSKFDRSHSVKVSFNIGDLIPFFVDEVLPGDTFSVDTSKVVRMPTLLQPIMDNIYLDTYFFFVPNRLVWEHWKEFNGENNTSPWLQTVEYEVPQVTAPTDGWHIGSVADYMGVPTGIDGFSVNALPFRAYSLICNEWFRDENLVAPLSTDIGDATVAGVNPVSVLDPTSAPPYSASRGGQVFKAAKFHDYFTSALPAPQKGPAVTIPLFDSGVLLPVYPKNGTGLTYPNTDPLHFYDSSAASTGLYNLGFTGSNFNALGIPSTSGTANAGYAIPDNLVASVGSTIAGATVNDLRMAFQIQKLYEKDARGGTRYIEILKAHFGVTSPDARLQRPEYLGGNRIPLSIMQVTASQGAGTGVNSVRLGSTGAFSLSTDRHSDFTHSFVEHGFVIGVMVARYDHTYQQGLERFWSRKGRFDYYWPVLANIGEQPILNKEIFLQGTDQDEEVFGYQEAWADYRYKTNRVCGAFRSSAPASLDVWHLADFYSRLPFLSSSWIHEDTANVERIFAIGSVAGDDVFQLFADVFIKNTCVRPMPMYSIPGLIDHH
ncbi:major capsid protein [Peromfec virus RodF8_43]|uniref:Major capsid protein n=1 Tax=Peromfec virus RodF8_43 TaxID=2929376 RepID=A0A976N2L4_9VIRU|nr:major capsid protein [Peromfec virus RodF8_43]